MSAQVHPPCALLVHFHFVKSAGTELRNEFKPLLDLNMCHRKFADRGERSIEHICGNAQRDLLFAPDGLKNGTWANLSIAHRRSSTGALVQVHQIDGLVAPGTHRYVYQEVHSTASEMLKQLRTMELLKAALATQGSSCRVITFTLLREPATQVVSHYYWAKPSAIRTGHFPVNGSLLEWASLLGPDALWGYSGSKKGACVRGHCTNECRAQHGAQAPIHELLPRLDIVVPTTAFHLLLLALKLLIGNAGLAAAACHQLRRAAADSVSSPCNHSLDGHSRSAAQREVVADYVPCSTSLYEAWCGRGVAALLHSRWLGTADA